MAYASDSILQKDNNVEKATHSHVYIVLTEPKSNTKGKIHTHTQILILTNRELKNKTKKKSYLRRAESDGDVKRNIKHIKSHETVKCPECYIKKDTQ